MLTEGVLAEIEAVVGEDWLINDPDQVKSYLEDESPEGARVEPATEVAVVKPENAEESSEIIRIADDRGIPIFIRGGATGLVCGCVPNRAGMVLSTERIKDISIDRENLTATVGAGVTLEQLIEESKDNGLSFPLHPGDEGAQMGGLIACNAGGSRAVKTGVMRNFVIGLQVVMPTDEIITVGGDLIKDNVGAGKLMHMFIGTEGIFGLITGATIKLLPGTKETATMVVPFDDKLEAMKVVPQILRSEIDPQGLEYVERKSIELAEDLLDMKWPCPEGEVFLILMFTESSEEVLYSNLERVSEVFEEANSLEPLLAEFTKEEDKILRIRSELYPSIKPEMYEDLDICVPISNLGEFIQEIDKISERYDTYVHPYGHAGDGNLHIHITEEEGWNEKEYDNLTSEIYRAGADLGGVVTGEHGIGESKKDVLGLSLSEESIGILDKLKKVLDPNNILNPGKVIEDSPSK